MIDIAKQYELSDSEWERISDFFPVSKTGRPPNGIIEQCSMQFYSLLAVFLHVRISQVDILLTKVFTADSANGEMMVL